MYALYALPFLLIYGLETSAHVHMCWYVNWSEYRASQAFNIDNLREAIKMSLCSHVIYSPAMIEPQTLETEFLNKEKAINDIQKLVQMKKIQQDLKIFLAIGGWDIKSYGFNEITNPENLNNIRLFSLQLINFLRKNSLDGLIVDYEFPNFEYSFSKPHTRLGFTQLLETLNKTFIEETLISNKTRLVLLAAVAARVDWIDKFYEGSKIVHYVDYLLLLSYDLLIYGKNATRISSALYPLKNEKDFDASLNQVTGVEKWLALGASTSQIILGIPAYGRSFQLTNQSDTSIGAPVKGLGRPGNSTNEDGVLAYFEICQKLAEPNVILKRQEDNLNPFLINNDLWVGFEDKESILLKMIFIQENNLAGAFLWSIDLDDFSGVYCRQEKFPLMHAITNSLKIPQSLNQRSSNIGSIENHKNTLIIFVLIYFF